MVLLVLPTQKSGYWCECYTPHSLIEVLFAAKKFMTSLQTQPTQRSSLLAISGDKKEGAGQIHFGLACFHQADLEVTQEFVTTITSAFGPHIMSTEVFIFRLKFFDPALVVVVLNSRLIPTITPAEMACFARIS